MKGVLGKGGAYYFDNPLPACIGKQQGCLYQKPLVVYQYRRVCLGLFDIWGGMLRHSLLSFVCSLDCQILTLRQVLALPLPDSLF